MAEYIDREKALKLLESAQAWGWSNNTLYDEMKDLPSADVSPVVHGKWDEIPNQYMSVVGKDGSYHGNVTSCSVCHEINPNAYKTNYCPNCGAKMDLEEN